MVTPTLNSCSAFTHPKCTHTQQWTHTHTLWTHTRSSGQPFMLRRSGSSWGFGALLKGLTSVVVLKVERALYIHSPHLKVQGSRFFIIRHIHNHTSIISSEMQVELKKNTAFTWGKWGEKNNSQTMLLGEYSVRTGKTPQQHKSAYTT